MLALQTWRKSRAQDARRGEGSRRRTRDAGDRGDVRMDGKNQGGRSGRAGTRTSNDETKGSREQPGSGEGGCLVMPGSRDQESVKCSQCRSSWAGEIGGCSAGVGGCRRTTDQLDLTLSLVSLVRTSNLAVIYVNSELHSATRAARAPTRSGESQNLSRASFCPVRGGLSTNERARSDGAVTPPPKPRQPVRIHRSLFNS